MSLFTSQFSRSLQIIPSKNAVIPTPYVLASGFNTDVNPLGYSELIDDTKDFIALGIMVGDVLYNTTGVAAATITAIINESTLQLNSGILTSTEQDYIIYQQSAASGIGNEGCYLYFSEETDARIVTIGRDEIRFFGIQAGSVLPVQLISCETVKNGYAIALW